MEILKKVRGIDQCLVNRMIFVELMYFEKGKKYDGKEVQERIIRYLSLFEYVDFEAINSKFMQLCVDLLVCRYMKD